MAKDSPTHPYVTGDDNNSNDALPVRTRDKIRNFLSLPKSKSKGLKNKSSAQSLNTQNSTQTTGVPLNETKPVVIPAITNLSGSLSAPVGNATSAPFRGMKSISDIFSKDLPKPMIKAELPSTLDRIEVTQQLVYAQRLIRHGQSIVSSGVATITERPISDSTNLNTPTALDKQGRMPDRAERAWIKSQDPMQQHHLQGLVDNVVAEFAKDDLKGSAAIAEVVILGPILDRNTYRRLLNHLVIRFKQDIYFDVPLLQGLVQLIEDASPGYLEHGDLVDTLGILRERLKQLHKPSSEKKDFAKDKSSFTDKSAGDHALSLDHKASFEQLYQITIAISRLLDVMVNNEVKNVNRISVHQSLVAALSELEDVTDPILQFQVQYALQASQYIPDDESTLQAVLRFGGGAFMLALGAAGICKLDPENLFNSLDNLRQAAGEAYAVVKQLPEGLEAFQQGRSGAARRLLHGMRTGTKHEWYLTLLFARTYVRHGQLAKFKHIVCGARCGDNQAFQLGVCQILGEVAMDPLWDTTIRQQAVDFLAALTMRREFFRIWFNKVFFLHPSLP
ncbi:hypothetical protein EC991_006770 [Linnemannia zychae]|nr:hypothetical protein EC991_006770 [Linnemannia zychae]